MSKRWVILVTFADGEQDYVCDGLNGNRISKFVSLESAEAQAAFLREGLDRDDRVQVVPEPSIEVLKP